MRFAACTLHDFACRWEWTDLRFIDVCRIEGTYDTMDPLRQTYPTNEGRQVCLAAAPFGGGPPCFSLWQWPVAKMLLTAMCQDGKVNTPL